MEPIFSGKEIPNEKSVIKRPVASKNNQPKRIAKRTSKDVSTPSIKDALMGKFGEDEISSKKQHEIFSKQDEIEEFSLDNLKLAWEKFLERLDDRRNLKSTLSIVPELRADFNLELEIENTVQEDLVNSIKPELVSWLRKKLKNSKIQLVTKIAKTTKRRVIYTDSEKFEEMAKKNPKLNLLKEKFNLDFSQ